MLRNLNRLLFLLTLTSLFPLFVHGLGTYIYNGVKCDYCPAGSFRTKHCTSSQRTQCETCPDGQYSPPNRGTHCLRCPDKDCRKIHHTVVELNCTKTHRAVCVCKPGYWLRSKHDPACKHHRYCPAGEGVSAVGTPKANTECKPCGEGTFSNKTSRTEPCIAHSICLHGIKIPGNKTVDIVCADSDGIAGEMSTLAPTTTESLNDGSSGNLTNVTGMPTGKPVHTLGGPDPILICVVSVIAGILMLIALGFGVHRCRQKCTHQDSSGGNGKQNPSNNNSTTASARHSEHDGSNVRLRMPSSGSDSSQGEQAGISGRGPLYQRTNSRKSGTCDDEADVDLLSANPGPSDVQKRIKPPVIKRRSSKVSDSGSVKVTNTQPSMRSRSSDKSPVTIEDLFNRIGEDIKTSDWRKTVRALPGIRMTDQNIHTIEYNFQAEGLDEVRYQCLLEWYKKNKTTQLDVIKTIRDMLVNENKSHYKKQKTLAYLDSVMIQ